MAHSRRDHPPVLDDADFYTQFATHVLTLAGMVGVVGWATGVNGRILALAGRIWTGRAGPDDEEALRRNLQAAETDQGSLAARCAHGVREITYRFSGRSEGAGRLKRAISPGSNHSEGSENPSPAAESRVMAELRRAERELSAAEARVIRDERQRQLKREEEQRREQVRLGKQPAPQNLPVRPGSNAGPSNPRPAASPAPAKMCSKCGKHRAEPDSRTGRCRRCRR